MTTFGALAADTARPQAARQELAARYPLVPWQEADVVVALGGDGLLIDLLHRLLRERGAGDDAVVFGMNRGTSGFLLNDWSPDDLEDRVARARTTVLTPLRLLVEAVDGSTQVRHAFNEVALRRTGSQVAQLRVLVDGRERLAQLKGDGVMVATPAGSTGYNQAAGGPVLPLDAGLVALTPVCPLRPRRWRGALLPGSASVRVEVQDPGKRPVAASPDQRGLHEALAVEVAQEPEAAVRLLFDEDRTLEDRYIAEQFLG